MDVQLRFSPQTVFFNYTESTWLAPRSGIPQGTVAAEFWGRRYFSFTSMIFPLKLRVVTVCAVFADDTTVHAASSDSKLSSARISADLDVAAEWADSWGMLFSAEKSEHLHIGKATGQRVTMRGVPIPQVKHHRHLGLVMNNKLSWTEHIKDVHGTCSRMIGVLRRLRRRLQGTTIKAIFIGAIRSRMEYASQVWSGGPTQSLQRLQHSFERDMGFACLHYRLDSTITLWFCSTRWDQVLHRRTYAHFFPRRASATTGYSFRKSGYPVPATRKSSTLSSFVPRSIVLWNAHFRRKSKSPISWPSSKPD